jgi:hypothetical protein
MLNLIFIVLELKSFKLTRVTSYVIKKDIMGFKTGEETKDFL